LNANELFGEQKAGLANCLVSAVEFSKKCLQKAKLILINILEVTFFNFGILVHFVTSVRQLIIFETGVFTPKRKTLKIHIILTCEHRRISGYNVSRLLNQNTISFSLRDNHTSGLGVM